jgi:hypothetical protein
MAERIGEGLTFEKVWALIQETGRQMKETDERLKETDRQMKESDRRLKERMEESDRRLKERMEETDRRLKETTRIVGDLGNKFGTLSEHLIVPNMVEKFNALGYEFTKAGRNIELRGPDKKILTEIDILLENGEFAMAVEIKSDLNEAHVRQHAERMEKLRRYWDGRGDRRKLLGAVAGAIMGEAAKRCVLEAGFYAVVQAGDTVKIETPEGFSPKVW